MEKIDYLSKNTNIEIPKVKLTYLQDQTLAKTFGIDANGKLTKTKTAFKNASQAYVIEANLPDLHDGLLKFNDLTIIYGYPVINGQAMEGEITLLSKKEFTTHYPDATPPFIKKVGALAGSISYALTRTKDNFRPSNFLIIDFDVGNEAPTHMKIQRTEDIIDIFQSVAPCFEGAMCVESFSSSSGLIHPNGTQLTDVMKRHLVFQVEDAEDIERFIKALDVKLVNAEFYYFVDSRDGKKLLRTLIDKQAVSPERFVYEVSPILYNGITQQRPAPRLLGHKLLDTKSLADPTPEELENYAKITGSIKCVSNGKTLSMTTLGTPERLHDLGWDQEIKLSDGTIITPKAFKDAGMSDTNCHSPFRDDNNPSAKIGINSSGNPFIYDAATHQTHFMIEDGKAIEGELVDDGAVAVTENDIFTEYTQQEAIDFMNKHYALVLVGGKCLVMEKNFYDHALEHHTIRFFSINELGKYNGHRIIKIDKKNVPIVTFWSMHKDAIRYDLIVFDPSQQPLPPNVFNLFRGLAYKPKKGFWRKYLWHIHVIICNRNKKLTKYLLAWIANMLQGRQKPGVAPVLVGGRGTGKGLFVTILGKLFGRHFLHIVQRSQLTGNFNAHFREAYLVFADESFFAGDKQMEGALKSLITEDTLMIEQKGIDAFPIKNFTNFIFATNNEQAVPAGQDERRFFVLNVSDKKQQDHDYFAAIIKQMLEEGGIEAMLHDLQALDLSNVNLRDVPATAALTSQKYQNDLVLQFMVDHIEDEYLLEEWDISTGVKVWTKRHWGDGKVAKAALYDAFVIFTNKAGNRHPMPKETFGKHLKKWIPKIKNTKINSATAYAFPSMNDCKISINEKLGTPWKWTDKPIKPTVPRSFIYDPNIPNILI